MRELSDDNTFPCLRDLRPPETWRAMMSESGGKTDRPWEPQRDQQQAHSPASKLPEGALVFFLVDSVLQLD